MKEGDRVEFADGSKGNIVKLLKENRAIVVFDGSAKEYTIVLKSLKKIKAM